MQFRHFAGTLLALIAALIWLAPASAVSFPPTLERSTAKALAALDAPGRDLISLTQRLKLGGSGSIPLVVNAGTPNYAVGTRQPFFVANITGKGYETINATVRYVTPHAYWYVKDGFAINQRFLEASANRFETNIYPTNRRIFGAESPEGSLGVDNDPRITMLIAPIEGVGGYFSNADTFPRAVNPYSNQRDMIYMAVEPEGGSGGRSNYFEATLAHEFQHMIEWNVKRDRDIWLDEGSSEIASFVNGYDVGGSDSSFVLEPDTQLNAWADVGDSSPHYGASYLFLRYLMERYGGEAFMSALLKEEGLGISAIDAVVKRAGGEAGFEGAFTDWTVANVLKDPTLGGGRYSYAEGGRVVPGFTISQYPATRTDNLHQYAADYLSLGGALPNGGTLSFNGTATVRAIRADAHSGRSYWYSNRRDSGDATLTREFDLTGVNAATLNFWTWYDIEPDYDYAYVEASTDGGKSWTTLKGKYTTTENPNGANFGNGWSGTSPTVRNPDNGDRAPLWVEESVTLTPYAGRKVLVRFEYVTDEGYNRPGFAIDDIRIPEIGYADNAETAVGAWRAEGFVRVSSKMPQRWFVALVEKGSNGRPNKVREMVVDEKGAGSIDLSPLAPGTASRNDVLVIVPLAPKTTETANWTVTVRGK